VNNVLAVGASVAVAVGAAIVGLSPEQAASVQAGGVALTTALLLRVTRLERRFANLVRRRRPPAQGGPHARTA
jgi:hypothetical protein